MGHRKSDAEIIYVDDLADACIHFMKIKTKKSLINIGTGIDLSITEYAKIILKVIGIKAKIKYILPNLTELQKNC